MHKIRYYLVVITLLASLSGFGFLGSASLASTALSHQSSATNVASMVGKSSRSVAFIPREICPGSGTDDC